MKAKSSLETPEQPKCTIGSRTFARRASVYPRDGISVVARHENMLSGKDWSGQRHKGDKGNELRLRDNQRLLVR